MKSNSELAARYHEVKQLREQGLSFAKIGKLCGVSKTAVMRWYDPDKYRARNRVANRHKRQQTKHATITYFILCNDFVKIGQTTNLPERLFRLQTGNPYELEVLGVTNTPESKLHKEFAALRLNPNSEWFYYTPAMQAFIESVAKPLVLERV